MTTIALTIATVGLACAAAGLAHYVIKPARARRRDRLNRELAQQIQRSRTLAVSLTVDLLQARNPRLWDEFIATHTDQPRGGE